MHISDEGLVAGSVNRAELVAAYAEATDPDVRANLAAVGAANGMSVQGDKLVDPSVPAEPDVEPEPTVAEAEAEPDSEPTQPAQADNKAAWVDWAVAHGLERDEAESYTKAELIDEFGE